MKNNFIIVLCIALCSTAFSQNNNTLATANAHYEIGGIEVKGAIFADANAIVAISGLQVGMLINNEKTAITQAIKKLWKTQLFDDVQVVQTKTIDQIIFLQINPENKWNKRARLSLTFGIEGQ